MAGLGSGLLGLGVGCASGELDCQGPGFSHDATAFAMLRIAVGGAVGAVIGARFPPKHWAIVPNLGVGSRDPPGLVQVRFSLPMR